MHGYVELLPRIRESPALRRIAGDRGVREQLVRDARVRLAPIRGFCWVDVAVPCIVLSNRYYREGAERDLYLDLLHELTHLRQISEGQDVWDERFEYADRATEIEGYAVAVGEGRRLGMTEGEILEHLTNPWMSAADVRRLRANVELLLGRGRPRPGAE
jgi:hypothetical protein